MAKKKRPTAKERRAAAKKESKIVSYQGKGLPRIAAEHCYHYPEAIEAFVAALKRQATGSAGSYRSEERDGVWYVIDGDGFVVWKAGR